MRRIVVLMTVVALMMVLLAMSVAPAFAAPSPERCEQLIIRAIESQHGAAPPSCFSRP